MVVCVMNAAKLRAPGSLSPFNLVEVSRLALAYALVFMHLPSLYNCIRRSVRFVHHCCCCFWGANAVGVGVAVAASAPLLASRHLDILVCMEFVLHAGDAKV